ncbi:MAG: T9SS type A sorting domain-containing protein [Flavobacteriales bacterium]|nr:T9SS type A sorting domain-containing protein [Flavobacteriales bacterium]
MKNIFLLFVLLFCYNFSFAQVWEEQLLLLNENATLAEKITAFNDYKSLNPYTKGNGYKPYARSLYFLEKRMPENGVFPSSALFTEWKKEKEKLAHSKISSSSNWQPLGPFDTPIILSNGKKRGNGRVNAIAFDPFDPDIIWIGSPGGGLWKTIDGGNNWTTNTDNLPVIGISSIVIHPTNNQIMYIATGDADGSDTYSVGVLKSIDGGNTWNTTGLSYGVNQSKRINKLIINPNYPDSLVAATNSGITISPDGGTTWISILTGRMRDVEFKPNNPSVIYAALDASSGASKIYRTTNAGIGWTILSGGLPTAGLDRILLGVTPANPEVVYALIAKSDAGFYGFYKSSDAGSTWVTQMDCPNNTAGCNILGRNTDGTSDGGQSWYDMSLAISPINENIIYAGGIALWESSNGGQNWNIEASSGSGNYAYMHVDQHALEYNPINNVLYAGNDGGFYKYLDNLNTWTDISDGLEISQFYRLGLSVSNADILIAGAQDNGTERLSSVGWDAIRGADGMECIIDPYNPNTLYSSSQYGGLRISYDGGNNWFNFKPVSYSGAWVTPYKMHPLDNNFIVAGYQEVYRTTTGGAFWDSISNNLTGKTDIRTIALAPSDMDVIYAATYSKLSVTFDGGNTWANIKPGLPSSTISDVTVSANDPNWVFVTFSNYTNGSKVYESTDGGNTWTNISGSNLPNLPVNCIVYQDLTNDDLYIGTDVGVYHKDNSMSEWQAFMTNLPNVRVDELEIHYGSSKIRAATFGRGIWESDLQTQPSGIANNFMSYVHIYPNPSNDYFILSTPENALNKNPRLIIYNLAGQIVLSEKIETTNQFIDVSKLKSAYYIYEISGIGLRTVRNKLIVLPN